MTPWLLRYSSLTFYATFVVGILFDFVNGSSKLVLRSKAPVFYSRMGFTFDVVVLLGNTAIFLCVGFTNTLSRQYW